MSLSLLLPTALFALLALALPLLIHLHRRRETPPPRLFAAIAYIDPQARPKQRVRLRDLLLLLLRLLLLATLALLLAQPLLHGGAGAPWVLLWPGLDPARIGNVGEDAELRWLAPGFPPVEAVPAPSLEQPFNLLRQLAFERPLAQAIEIRVPRQVEGWDGAPLRLGRAIDWTVLPVDLPAPQRETKPLRVAVLVMEGVEDAQHRAVTAVRAYFEALGEASPLRWVDAGEAPDAEGVDTLWIVGSTEAFEHAGHVHAAAESEHDDTHDEAEATPAPGTPLAVAHSALQSLPSHWRLWLREGGRVLMSGRTAVKPVESTEPAADTLSRTLWLGAHARVTRHAFERAELHLLDCGLDARCLPELLEPDFPNLLRAWLAPAPAAASRMDARLVAPSAEGIAPQPKGTPLRDALIGVLLLLVLAERWLAAAQRPA